MLWNIYLKDVVSLSLEEERCIGCGLCTIVCPHNVFQLHKRRAKIVEKDRCMECGACATNCPAEAIGVVAGVGCAQAIINSITGQNQGGCCCSLEDSAKNQNCGCDPSNNTLG